MTPSRPLIIRTPSKPGRERATTTHAAICPASFPNCARRALPQSARRYPEPAGPEAESESRNRTIQGTMPRPAHVDAFSRVTGLLAKSVAWTTRQMVHTIMPDKAEDWHDTTDSVVMGPFPPSPRLDRRTHQKDGYADRFSDCLHHASRRCDPPKPDTVVQDGDKIHFLFNTESRDAVTTALCSGPNDRHTMPTAIAARARSARPSPENCWKPPRHPAH